MPDSLSVSSWASSLERDTAPTSPELSTILSFDGDRKKKPTKTKRKQLCACDSCRLRRVKCVREPGESICVECQKKGIACTSIYVSNKLPKTARAGKRIHQARVLYGEQRTDSFGLSDSDTGISMPSESASMLASHLLDVYSSTVHARFPFVDFARLHMEFEGANRNVAEMGDSEALCVVVQAVAARYSDSASIIGEGPRLSSLSGHESISLAQYGLARETFVDLMGSRAMRIIDSKGTMHTPSIENVCALFLLQNLIENAPTPGRRHKARHYSAALIEMLRALAETSAVADSISTAEGDTQARLEREARFVSNGQAFCHVLLHDALQAAYFGRPCQLSSSDISFFCPWLVTTDLAQVRADIANNGRPPTLTCAATIFGSVAMLARAFCEQVSGPVARRDGGLKIEFIRSFYEEADQCFTFFEICQLRWRELYPDFRVAFDTWIRTCNFCLAALVAVTDEMLIRVAANRRASGASESDPVTIELDDLILESAARTFAFSRYAAKALQNNDFDPACTPLGGDVCICLVRFARHVLKTPLAHEGGPSDYTAAERTALATQFLDGLKKLGWQRGEAGEHVEALTAEIEAIDFPHYEEHQLAAPLLSSDTLPDLFSLELNLDANHGEAQEERDSYFPNMPFPNFSSFAYDATSADSHDIYQQTDQVSPDQLPRLSLTIPNLIQFDDNDSTPRVPWPAQGLEDTYRSQDAQETYSRIQDWTSLCSIPGMETIEHHSPIDQLDLDGDYFESSHPYDY
ncbi:uncharacterized protein L969DRAFT_91679 [Mixia osmundae IAM 14324]|uniref:Zn(2)-C6 fungal-type domain-containing protein n=1 Tax=Mixia osmundae (strain CBS 9802 / IAM 14324 / JCM 22182 / KY 12970) TaxID=764103 RepID=G7E070_MIXOS|nr:uncharacterized protein L969DRAFT_91679 [Mixia osmundae IAM 14324]KEI42220.1 hypothetical protein L969DRAFT_91679 [Mixia osmundae IAM 14324]GAA96230.1 hypothetical protein E5Q_02894 [Mixia osmundae IAM 14324]